MERFKRPPHFDFNFIQTLQYYNLVLQGEAEISSEALRVMRSKLASEDLFFLLTDVLKRKDLIHPWLFARCREVQAEPDGCLDLWAREHGKSSVITFGLTFLDIINDPEITIGIFSHTKSIARDFLKQIKTEMEVNEDLYYLWPDIFWADPRKEAKSWSVDGGILVKRNENPKEMTVEGHGLVDGQPTGRHFKLLIYDDVVTRESVATPEQISKTTEAWQLSDNLGAVGGSVRYIGTRYHLFDTYSVMIDSGVIKPRTHPATIDGTEYGTPVLMAADVLQHKRRVQGAYVFSSQMLLNPVADKAMGFMREWLVHADTDYAAAMRSLWRMIIVDPAGGKQRKPGEDYTSMFVLGYGADDKWRVLQIIRDRLNLSGRCKTLMDLHRHWKPHAVFYEEYGIQADVEHIQYVQNQELYQFQIDTLGGSMNKKLRILRLIPYFESGRIILPTTQNYINYENRSVDMVRSFVEEEYTAFPVLKHDDLMDCLARIVDIEALGVVQKPSITPAPLHELDARTGFQRMQKNQGVQTWYTV
jgi:phage terminase large subunit-like protein